MPIPKKYLADFTAEHYYHVYNRTNNKENLFNEEKNYYFFLSKYKSYLGDYVDTFCWCLLPNHFHLLILIKSEDEIRKNLNVKPLLSSIEKNYLAERTNLSVLVVQAFKKLFQSYTLSFNKEYSRSGNLFYRPFKRILVEKDSHFTQAIIYIHANAVKHQLCKDFTKYRWSSWEAIMSDKPTKLCREEMIEWFGGLQQLIQTHCEMAEYYYKSDIAIED